MEVNPPFLNFFSSIIAAQVKLIKIIIVYKEKKLPKIKTKKIQGG